MKKIFKSNYFYFLIFLVLLLIVFRSIVFNLDKNLVSWFDYPYIIWVINQNINHFRNLDFVNFFNTNAFYPFKGTLLFSDLLLPQSLIALPFSFFIGNPIIVFNILFFITFILNYFSLFLFWNNIFKNKFISFFGSVMFIFSSYFYTQLGHFQMLCYWSLFFALYFLMREKKEIKNNDYLYVSLLLCLQFLASAYLCVFLIVVIAIWFFYKFIFDKKNILKNIKSFFFIFIIFFIVDGFFIKSYIDVKNQYNIIRPMSEYIQYSAHLTDYIFYDKNHSIFDSFNLLDKWNKFNYHVVGEKALFVGFLPFIIFIFGLFKFIKNKKEKYLSINLDFNSLYFLTILVVGFIFSLGPRLNFNGNYVSIPLPYLFFMNYLPLFDSIRSLARWSFLVSFSVLYFSLDFIYKKFILKKSIKNYLIILLIFIFWLIEFLPINLKFISNIEYFKDDYNYLKNNCIKDKSVLLEIPYTHLFGVKDGISNGVAYISMVQLSSLKHKCNIVNGYSGYDLPENIRFFNELNTFSDKNDYLSFLEIIKSKNVQFIKFNLDQIGEKELINYRKLLEQLVENKKIERVSEKIYKIN